MVSLQSLWCRLRRHPSVVGWLMVVLAAFPVGAFYWDCTSFEREHEGALRYHAHRYHALQAEAWLQGRLDLPLPVPAGLTALPDPYDPKANLAFRMSGAQGIHDLSLYKGRLYLYWGPVPALVAFLPWRVITGTQLDGSWAGLTFAFLAWLASGILLVRIAARNWPQVPPLLLLPCLWALGVCSWAPVMLRRCSVWELPILSATCFGTIMVALLAECLGSRGRARIIWLVGASLALGLAVGSRPTWIVWSPCLLWPLWALRKELPRRDVWLLASAAVLPVSAAVVGLLVLNHLRFDNFLDFGQQWQLASVRVQGSRSFALSQVPYNVWHYLFSPPELVEYFPFISEPRRAEPPEGYLGIENTFGLFMVLPWLWFSVLNLWRRHRASIAPVLLLGGLAMLALLGLFNGAAGRYQAELAVPLALLACCGVMQLEARLERARWWWRSILMLSLAGSTIALFLVSSSYSRWITARIDDSPRMEAAANRLAVWLGWCPRDGIEAVEIQADFSLAGSTATRPGGALLASGCFPWINAVGVGFPEPNKLVFQAMGYMSVQSAVEVRLDRSVPHLIRVELGSLLPPERHPFWTGIHSDVVRGRREQYRILCDGVVILKGSMAAYPPFRAQPQIGSVRDPSGPLTNVFPGRILDVRVKRMAAP